MPTHRIRCSNIADLRKKHKLAMALYKGEGMDVRTMVKGTLQARDGDLVFATSPLPIRIFRRLGVYADEGWHDVDLSKSDDVELWLYVRTRDDQQLR
jgi:hypothetical protein